MGLVIEEGRYRGWDAIFLRAGTTEVALAPGLGGRVLQIAAGGAEPFYVEERPPLWPPSPRRYWGGSKAWLAPQSAWGGDFPEPRALDDGAYRVRVSGQGDRRTVWMESPCGPETGFLRVFRGVDVAAGIVSIGTRLVNEGAVAVARGIWEVAQIERPCEVAVQAPRLDAYAEEGDSLALAPLVTSRASDGGTIIRCDRAARFKLGARAQPPVRVRRMDRDLAWRLDFLPRPSGDDAPPAARSHFAHGDRNVEVYNSADLSYLEVEVHAPLRPLGKGEESALSVVWTLEPPT